LFFVAQLDEGIALRRLLPDCEIAVLNGVPPGTAGDFTAHRLIPVLNDLSQIAEWRRSTEEASQAIIHVDTGMARLGLPPDELAQLAARPDLLGGITVRAVMSHLAAATTRRAGTMHGSSRLPRRARRAAARAGQPFRLVRDLPRG